MPLWAAVQGEWQASLGRKSLRASTWGNWRGGQAGESGCRPVGLRSSPARSSAKLIGSSAFLILCKISLFLI